MKKSTTQKSRFAWYMYDWASSAFTTTVVTVFLGPYLTSIATSQADSQGLVYAMGIPIAAASLFPYAISLSVFMQLLLLPLLGAYADAAHLRKTILIGCTIVGAIATMSLYWVQPGYAILGALAFVLANTAYGASIVSYNAMLSDIAEPNERDAVSSNGFAIGYAGGGILLLLNLLLYINRESLGLDGGHAVRIALASAGIWWLIFTVFPFMSYGKKEPIKHISTHSLQQLLKTCKGSVKYPHTLLFLLAYLLYNDGVQTVIAMAAQFGQEELGLSLETLQTSILLVQIVALFGALLFGRIAQRFSAKTGIILSISIWTCIIAYAYAFLPKQDPIQFYMLSMMIAIVLGGSQALSRSLFSSMIPKNKEAEYFSFYELTDRGTSWLGPLLFGLGLQFTGSYRIAMAFLLFFFVVGGIMLLFVNTQKAQHDALQ